MFFRPRGCEIIFVLSYKYNGDGFYWLPLKLLYCYSKCRSWHGPVSRIFMKSNLSAAYQGKLIVTDKSYLQCCWKNKLTQPYKANMFIFTMLTSFAVALRIWLLFMECNVYKFLKNSGMNNPSQNILRCYIMFYC